MIKRWEPAGNSIHEKWLDNGFIVNKDGFILLTLVGTSKEPDDAYMGSGSGDYRSNMGTEGKIRVENNSEYTGRLFQRQQGVVQGDVKMSNGLCKLMSEE